MSNEYAPWYRQPWPWILMSGPAIVVVAGIGTAVIAARSADGLVTEDYYRQGIAINGTLARERHAADLGLAARMSFGGKTVRIELPPSAPATAGLRLALTHPARAQDDESVDIRPVGSNIYEGTLRSAPRGVSRLVLEDRERTWRLDGAMRDAPASITLGAARP